MSISYISSNVISESVNTISKSRYCIWAEESGDIDSNATEWAFGNGNETPSGTGVIIINDCKIVGLAISHEQPAITQVEVTVNGLSVNISCTNANTRNSSNALEKENYYLLKKDDVISFKTIMGSNFSNGSVATCWLEMEL